MISKSLLIFYYFCLMEPLTEAFRIAIIGMATVSLILGLVVLCGMVIIRLTNRYVPSSVPPARSSHTTLDRAEVAVLTAAVEAVTGGRGRIVSIEKEA